MEHVRKSPLHEKHQEMGAKLVEYHGWYLPVEYSGIMKEVHETRQGAALFDASHMGEIMISGHTSKRFLQQVLTNDLSRQGPGQVLYSPLCQEDGGTLDDLLVYCFSRERYMLVVNAANIQQDLEWLQQLKIEGTEISDVSDRYALLALQGPRSSLILQTLMDVSEKELKYFRFMPEVTVAGIKVMLSRTGYTGEDGFEIYVSPQEALALWDALWEAASQKGTSPEEKKEALSEEIPSLTAAGLGARDLLRLEAALPLYGHELSKEITPLEAGLGNFVALQKEIPFWGQTALQKQQEKGLVRRLAGLEMRQRGIPRQGYPVMEGAEEIGWVSSGTYSPTLQKAVGLAFLSPERIAPGTEVEVMIRGKRYPSRVAITPFYRRDKK